MNTVEKVGKTLDEALIAAAKELDAAIENIDYVVLETGSKGFLGLGAKPVKISATVKFFARGFCLHGRRGEIRYRLKR